MPQTNVRSRWSGGDLIFETLSGTEVFRIADSKIRGDFEASQLKINGTALTPSAADLNHLLAADANGLVAADLTKLADVTVSAAIINLLTQGVAGAYKIARGVDTPTGGSDTIAAGLATVVAVVVSLEDEPTLTHMWSQGDAGDQAGSPAAGSFILTSSKPTGSGDVSPVAATTPWSPVHWIAVGT